MNPVSKIIFNALSSHGGVTLPGIGTMVVDRQPAKMKSRTKLAPPRNYVRFTPEEQSDVVSVIQLINRTTMDMEAAQGAYNSWLEVMGVGQDARTNWQQFGGNIAIEGVGELRNNTFSMAPALNEALNPESGEMTALTPRLSNFKVVMAVLAVLAVGVGAYLIFHRTPEQIQYAYMKRQARELGKENLDLARRGVDVIPHNEITNPSAGQSELAAGEDSVARPMYHLVMGVFSSTENAELFIKQLAKKEPSMSCTIIPMGNKFIVSGYQFTREAEANARKAEITDQFPDAWIYKKL